MLCEKELATRFKTLITNDLVNQNTLPLINIGKHFYFEITGSWFVVGRNREENDVIEHFNNSLPSAKGKPAVYYYSVHSREALRREAETLQRAYQNKDTKAINYYSNWKL